MQFIAEQKASIATLLTDMSNDALDRSDINTYLKALIRYSIRLARIVHLGQKDKAGKPYIQHAMRVAAKATTVVGFCIRVLHDAVEDGKELGITVEWLRDVFKLPLVIVEGIDAISRREGETYNQYLTRVARNYQAVKAKIDDKIDNADISRYDNPTHQDVLACGRCLEKVWMLKSSEEFQADQKYDLQREIMAVHNVSPLAVMVIDDHADDQTLYTKLSFGYEGHQTARYIMIMNANSDDSGKVRMCVSIVPTEKDYADQYIFKPQRAKYEFPDMASAKSYIDAMHEATRIAKMQRYPFDATHPWTNHSFFNAVTERGMMAALDSLFL
jgi:hypothetical protein